MNYNCCLYQGIQRYDGRLGHSVSNLPIQLNSSGNTHVHEESICYANTLFQNCKIIDSRLLYLENTIKELTSRIALLESQNNELKVQLQSK